MFQGTRSETNRKLEFYFTSAHTQTQPYHNPTWMVAWKEIFVSDFIRLFDLGYSQCHHVNLNIVVVDYSLWQRQAIYLWPGRLCLLQINLFIIQSVWNMVMNNGEDWDRNFISFFLIVGHLHFFFFLKRSFVKMLSRSTLVFDLQYLNPIIML